MKVRRRRSPKRNGFTLIEVVVSMGILLLVSQTVFLSISVSGRINQYAYQMRMAGNEIGRQILETADREKGEVSLEFGEYRICTDGYLYTGEEVKGHQIRVIWVETGDGGRDSDTARGTKEKADTFGKEVSTNSNAGLYEAAERGARNE